MGPDAMILVFWMLSFKPTFSLSSFTFIKSLFSSLVYAIRMVSSANLRLLIFLPVVLIPAYASSSPAFLMIYSAYKWNKQGDNIQPWRTAFPIWNQSVVPCPVLTVASWEICTQVKKQPIEPEMEQQTGSKLGKEYVKAVYCHPVYLTSMQSTS